MPLPAAGSRPPPHERHHHARPATVVVRPVGDTEVQGRLGSSWKDVFATMVLAHVFGWAFVPPPLTPSWRTKLRDWPDDAQQERLRASFCMVGEMKDGGYKKIPCLGDLFDFSKLQPTRRLRGVNASSKWWRHDLASHDRTTRPPLPKLVKPPPTSGECFRWCGGEVDPFPSACKWHKCKGCSECAAVAMAPPPPPAPLPDRVARWCPPGWTTVVLDRTAQDGFPSAAQARAAVRAVVPPSLEAAGNLCVITTRCFRFALAEAASAWERAGELPAGTLAAANALMRRVWRAPPPPPPSGPPFLSIAVHVRRGDRAYSIGATRLTFPATLVQAAVLHAVRAAAAAAATGAKARVRARIFVEEEGGDDVLKGGCPPRSDLPKGSSCSAGAGPSAFEDFAALVRSDLLVFQTGASSFAQMALHCRAPDQPALAIGGCVDPGDLCTARLPLLTMADWPPPPLDLAAFMAGRSAAAALPAGMYVQRRTKLGYAISAVDAAVGADQNTTVKAQWVAAWLRAADLERELRRADSELMRRTTRSMKLRRQVS